MALSKETVIDRIEITENGSVQIRHATYFLEDGVRVAGPHYHRGVVDADKQPPALASAAMQIRREVIAHDEGKRTPKRVVAPERKVRSRKR